MMKPYPDYKDSGVAWLGQIPAHWDVRKTKYLFSERVEKGFPNEPLLAATQTKGVVQKSDYENRTVLAQKDLHLLKRVKVGDFVISLRSFQGGIEYAYCQGIISPAYTIMVAEKDIFPEYFKYLAKSYLFIELLKTCVTGIREGQNIDYDILRRENLPLPPFEEQIQIARFLDDTCEKIDRFIANKQRMAALLREQKQAVITAAVTGQLGGCGKKPNAKDANGARDARAWLGDIPRHWIVKPLKRWATINQHALSESTDPNYEFNYLEIGSVSTGYLVNAPEKMTFKNAPSRARRIVQKGDTIISTVRTYLKAIYYIEETSSNVIASTGFAVLSPNANVYPKFLSFVMQSDPFIHAVTANSVGIAYPAIAETRLGSFPVAMPDNIEEQRAITQYIEKESHKIDTIIARTEREIALMQEYRARLIADVVTGQIDVREKL